MLEEKTAENLIIDNRALFELSGDLKPDTGEIIEPVKATKATLKNALSKTNTLKKSHYHASSSLIFTIRAMSTEGYTAFRNVEMINPKTGEKTSSTEEDDEKRNRILLQYGVAEPELDEDDINAMLIAPGWGPSNDTLVDAILQINPSADSRLNDVALLMGLSRFLLIREIMRSESGIIDDEFERYNLEPETKEKILNAEKMFSEAFGIKETAKLWGNIPLTKEELVKRSKKSKKKLSNILEDIKIEEKEIEDINTENGNV